MYTRPLFGPIFMVFRGALPSYTSEELDALRKEISPARMIYKPLQMAYDVVHSANPKFLSRATHSYLKQLQKQDPRGTRPLKFSVVLVGAHTELKINTLEIPIGFLLKASNQIGLARFHQRIALKYVHTPDKLPSEEELLKKRKLTQDPKYKAFVAESCICPPELVDMECLVKNIPCWRPHRLTKVKDPKTNEMVNVWAIINPDLQPTGLVNLYGPDLAKQCLGIIPFKLSFQMIRWFASQVFNQEVAPSPLFDLSLTIDDSKWDYENHTIKIVVEEIGPHEEGGLVNVRANEILERKDIVGDVMFLRVAVNYTLHEAIICDCNTSMILAMRGVPLTLSEQAACEGVTTQHSITTNMPDNIESLVTRTLVMGYKYIAIIQESKKLEKAPKDDEKAPEDDEKAPEYDEKAPEEDEKAPEEDEKAPEEDEKAPEEDDTSSSLLKEHIVKEDYDYYETGLKMMHGTNPWFTPKRICKA
jgi:hypothetical protein